MVEHLPAMGSSELIPCFALLICVAFALITAAFISALKLSHFFLQFSPHSTVGFHPAVVSAEDTDPCFPCLSHCRQTTCQGSRLPWPRSSATCGTAMPGSPFQSCHLTELPAQPASPSQPRAMSLLHQPEALNLPCVRKSNTLMFPSYSHCGECWAQRGTQRIPQGWGSPSHCRMQPQH